MAPPYNKGIEKLSEHPIRHQPRCAQVDARVIHLDVSGHVVADEPEVRAYDDSEAHVNSDEVHLPRAVKHLAAAAPPAPVKCLDDD